MEISDGSEGPNQQLASRPPELVRRTNVGVRKYVVAFLLSFSLLLVCEIWISLAAVNNATAAYFKTSGFACEWFSAVFSVTFVFQAIPSLFIPQLIGIKRCIVVGSLLIFVGCLVRTLAFSLGYASGTAASYTHISFWLIIVGNVIVSFSQCLLTNIPSLVSSVYFKEAHQLTSTTLIVDGSILGTAIGFVFSPLVMGEAQIIEKTQIKFLTITITETVLCAVIFIASIFVIPSSEGKENKTGNSGEDQEDEDKQKTTPSKGLDLLLSVKRALIDVLRLLKSPKFLILFTIYGFYYAFSTVFYVIFSSIVEESIEMDNKFLITYGGSLAVVAGAALTAVLSGLLTRYGSNRTSVIASSVLMFLCAVPLILILILTHFHAHTKASMAVLTILYGMFAAPYLGLGYDIISKAAAPISENIPVTAALIFSNIFCVILFYSSPHIPSGYRNQTFLMMFAGLYILMGIVHFFVKVPPPNASSQPAEE